jgi:hypothetical protein
MEELLRLSPYLVAAGIAWIIAQTIKFLLATGIKDKQAWRMLYQSGRMPSAHTATMVALTTTIAVYDGISSGLFALAALVTCVVIYDAVMVRRSSGEQGMALHKLLRNSKQADEPLPHLALGHQPLEVAAGALLGVLVGLSVAFFITK